VTGLGGSISNANSALGFSLASLPSVTDERLEMLGDDDLCLLINKFQGVYHNRQRKKNPGCYHCGDLNHFIADCPKKSGGGQNNHFDYYRHRDRDEGVSNKERRCHKHRSRDRGGRFDKESLKKRFQYKAKKREKAFLVQLSDFDKSSDTDCSSSPTSDDDDKKKKKKRDKEATDFIGLCLAAGRRKSFCTMASEANGAHASAGGHATPTHDDSSPGSESDSVVNSTIDLLDTEVRELYATLDNQKRLLKEAARERRKLRAELDCATEKFGEDECAGCISHMNDLVALRAKHDENIANLDVAKTSLADVSHELDKAKHELELAKDAPIISDVIECDEYPIFKSDLASL